MSTVTEIELYRMMDDLDDLNEEISFIANESAERLPPRIKSLAEMFERQYGTTLEAYATRHEKSLNALRKTQAYRKAARQLKAAKRARTRWFHARPKARKLRAELRKLAAEYKPAVMGSLAATSQLKEEFLEIVEEFL
jgi:hypothetical protein